MQLTRIPYSARSAAADAAELDDRRLGRAVDDRCRTPGAGRPWRRVDDRAPPPCSAMCRAARWLPNMTPKTFTAMTRCEVRTGRSRSRRRKELEMPALLNMTCRPSEAVDGEVDQGLDLVRVGHVGPFEDGRRSPSAPASSSPRSVVHVGDDDPCPWSTNSSTVARPIPLDPPVTIATLPVSSWPISPYLQAVLVAGRRCRGAPGPARRRWSECRIGTRRCKHYSLRRVIRTHRRRGSESRGQRHQYPASTNRWAGPAPRWWPGTIASNTALSYHASSM